MSGRDEYVRKMKAQLDEWNAELDKLSAKAEKANADSRIEYEQRIERLQREREDYRQHLDELQHASGQAWDSVRRGMEDSWERMSRAFREANSRFRQ